MKRKINSEEQSQGQSITITKPNEKHETRIGKAIDRFIEYVSGRGSLSGTVEIKIGTNSKGTDMFMVKAGQRLLGPYRVYKKGKEIRYHKMSPAFVVKAQETIWKELFE